MRFKSSTRACQRCGVVFERTFRNAKKRGDYCGPLCFIEGWTDRTNDCWIWTGPLVWGYGQTRWRGRNYRVHRWIWELTYGTIPWGLFVCHRCDNRACSRPDHLFLGTAADNQRDMAMKGRSLRGDRNPSHLHPESRARGEAQGAAKLVTAQVITMRAQRASGVTMRELAQLYGVSASTVHRVVHRALWQHV